MSVHAGSSKLESVVVEFVAEINGIKSFPANQEIHTPKITSQQGHTFNLIVVPGDGTVANGNSNVLQIKLYWENEFDGEMQNRYFNE